MRILVCGGRDFDDYPLLNSTLNDICDEFNLWFTPDKYMNCLPKIECLIHGGAKGADMWADYWAVHNWVPILEFKANWDLHGKSAGPIRNKQMLDEGKPDLVIAFPGGRGTANMIQQARKAGVKVREIE